MLPPVILKGRKENKGGENIDSFQFGSSNNSLRQKNPGAVSR